MIRSRPLFIVLAVLSLSSLSFAATPEQILLKADEFRNPQLDYTVSVKISSYKPGKESTVSTYKSMVKGRNDSIVETLTPEIDRGRVLLMSGNNFWGYLPNVSKPLRISLQERLVGEVANGDLARANFSGDYAVRVAGKKVIEGTKCTVLDLKAKTEDVTYGRVVLYVESSTSRPVRAEFYAFSGRLLKTCAYGKYKPMGGKSRPTKLVMRDAINKDQYSVLDYSGMDVKPLPEKYFTKDYMKVLTNE